MSYINTTDLEFNDLIKNNKDKLIVVDFWAPWCWPCQTFWPIFEQISNEFDDVIFAKLNVDENPKTAINFNVMWIPTILFIKNGETILQNTWIINSEEFKEIIENNK